MSKFKKTKSCKRLKIFIDTFISLSAHDTTIWQQMFTGFPTEF